MAQVKSAAKVKNSERQKSEKIELLRMFGECLGKGFQIHDDLLEITSDSKTMGKSLDSDIFEGKQTMMVIKGKQYFKESWDSIVLNSKKSDLKKNIYAFFNEKKIIEETKHIAESYFKKPSTIGSPKSIKGLEDLRGKTRYSTAVGLLLYRLKELNLMSSKNKYTSKIGSILDRYAKKLSDYFQKEL